MKQLSKFASFFVFPTFVLCTHLFASQVLNLYKTFPNLDIPFHFAGGLSIAYTSTRIVSYLEKENIIPALPQVLFLILIFSLTATATVFWEFAEFVLDQWMNTNIQISLANTMQDQLMGILGGAAWLVFYARKFEKIIENHLPG
jgi:hypothetical protein